MGICVSVDKNSDLDMKFQQSLGSKNGKVLIQSPVKDNNGKPIFSRDRSIAQVMNDQWSPPHPAVVSVSDFGSKDDTFFDSQPWIESDCEDDFFSVNGDFTPSRGSNASRPSFTSRTSQFNDPLFDEKPPLPRPDSSPITRRKRLADLFRDSVREQPKELEETPVVSGSNSERTANDSYSVHSSERSPDQDYRTRRGKPPRPGQRCLPRLLTSRSSRERKRSPVPSSVN